MNEDIKVVYEEEIEEKNKGFIAKGINAIKKHKTEIVAVAAFIGSAVIGYTIGKKLGVPIPDVTTENVIDGVLDSIEETEEI